MSNSWRAIKKELPDKLVFMVHNKYAEVIYIGTGRNQEAIEKRMAKKEWANEISHISYQPWYKAEISKLINRHQPRYHKAWANMYKKQPKPREAIPPALPTYLKYRNVDDNGRII